MLRERHGCGPGIRNSASARWSGRADGAVMLWHCEIVLQLILVSALWKWPDGRPKFAGLMLANLVMEIAMLWSERIADYTGVHNVWYWCVVLEVPLVAMALREALRNSLAVKYHALILSWWVACTMGCAWIRFYPYTGVAVVLLNCLAYLAWIYAKGIASLDAMLSEDSELC